MIRKYKYLFILCIAFPLACASVITEEVRNKANDSISFSQVLQKPDAYKGQTVVWGGEVIKSEAQKDGSMVIEVFQRPLGVRDAPDIYSESEGRFIIRAQKFLDPYAYRTGSKITVAGVIEGEDIRPLGKMSYRYPVILNKEIYLWDDSYYQTASDPFPIFPVFYEPYPTHRHRHRHILP
jgi:outer membrane lipoprotein